MVKMSYDFIFDLSRLSQPLFKEIAEFSEKERVHEKIGDMARKMVQKFHVDKITGLPICDSITVIEDLINIQITNSLLKEHFNQANKRALFLPHCCRKYMDSRCKAEFDSETTSYVCNHCSQDCMINQATKLAKKEQYDVYVLPGGSCIRKIIQKNTYEGVIGVACTDELKVGTKILEQFRMPSQSIPLVKNGCSDTRFNFETLERVMSDKKLG